MKTRFSANYVYNMKTFLPTFTDNWLLLENEEFTFIFLFLAMHICTWKCLVVYIYIEKLDLTVLNL